MQRKILRNCTSVRKLLMDKTKIQIKLPKAGEKSAKKSAQPPVKTVSLTNKIMQELSTYYELAIRRNPDSNKGMKRDIWATYYHKISTDDNPQHSHCPPGETSWCKYRAAEASGNLKNVKHSPAIEGKIQPLLKTIYEDLSSDDLLRRCLGANTQNNNESFNFCVWYLAPKHMFVGKKIVQIATNCALCIFNEGFKPLLMIMEVKGITIRKAAAALAKRQNNARISAANDRSSKATKKQRMQIREEKIRENELFEETEGILYGAGIAN